ncbi:MAG: flippase-like domain-containing protein [Aquabacterium sp.]|nr:MAG: flippase-like domain-containing protein [Aquabacterium sp.]
MTRQALAPEAATLAVPLWRRILVYGFFGVFALWCIKAFWHDITQIDLSPLHSGWPAVVVAGLLSLLNYGLRVVRWRLYLDTLGHRLSWRFVALTFMAGFAFTLSPGKLGEMVRARYYQSHGISIAAVSGAFFVERLLDLLVMILLAVAVLADVQAYRSFLWLAVALVGVLLAGVALMPWARIELAMGHTPLGKVRQTIKAAAHMFVSARQFLAPSILFAGLGIGMVAWAAEAIGLKLVADVVAPVNLSVSAAMGIYAIAIIVGALSFLPGGLGSTEAVMAALLFAHGYTMPQAILLTLVCRLLTLWLAVVIGWLCVWALRSQTSSNV